MNLVFSLQHFVAAVYALTSSKFLQLLAFGIIHVLAEVISIARDKELETFTSQNAMPAKMCNEICCGASEAPVLEWMAGRIVKGHEGH